MEIETKVKVDPNRQQKVFTAQQVVEAVIKAQDDEMEFVKRTIKESGLEIELPLKIMNAHRTQCEMFMKYFQAQLGIDGPDGAYIDAPATNHARK